MTLHQLKKIDSPIIRYYLKRNIDIVEDQQYDPKKHSLLVLGLSRNILDYYKTFNDFIKEMSETFGNVKFAYLFNNIWDDKAEATKQILDHLNSVTDNVATYVIPDETIHMETRIAKLAEYRETLFNLAIKKFGSEFDYVMMYDTDTGYLTAEKIAKSLAIKNDWSAITGNLQYHKSNIYYDELALRQLEDPIDIQLIHKQFHSYYGKTSEWVSAYRIFYQWTKVKAAFGGVSIYKTKELLDIQKEHGALYNLSDYPSYTAEHISLCLKLSKDILVCPHLSFHTDATVENLMQKIAFIPRDAGFFSVFNFLVGTIATGIHAYPNWNREELLKMHGQNDHFAYWTDKPNCWFDYFEPIKYYADDECHLGGHYLDMPKNCGTVASEEFKLPRQTMHLMKNEPEKFKKWRNKIHAFYSSHIKFHKDILASAENFWHSNYNNDDIVIGIHYRHPSHFIESGKVYLQQYFDEIDPILEKHPDAKIFLATDSQFGIFSFVERYKDRVRYYDDIDRITMAEFLEWAFSLSEGRPDIVGFINGKGHELHHKRIKNQDNKKMTIDLLKEVICLSKCDYLINTVSNIPLAISYMNPAIEIKTL